MKTHMVVVRRDPQGGTTWEPMCGGARSPRSRGDGLAVTFRPSEVTCAYCNRYDLERAAIDARRMEDKYGGD